MAALVLLCSAGTAQNTSPVARASSVSGRALLFNSGATVPTALTAGYILIPGDRVDTRGGGRVVIELSDGSMVIVSPESVVTLKDFRAASSLRELFEITLGMVRVKINHFGGKPNPYRMNSPTASIAVRGTEFTIEVEASGATQVTVIEGAVEVTSLADPARSVLLQAGQTFRLIAGNLPLPGNRGDGDRRPDQQVVANNGQPPKGPAQRVDGAPPPPGAAAGPWPPQQPQQPNAGKANVQQHNDRDRDEVSPGGNAGTYNRYLAGLADIAQVPLLLRFNAFAEPHLDALENPAFATTFRSAEGRLYFLPTFHGSQPLEENQSAFGSGGGLPSDYTVSPQLSFFAPAGAFTFGGSAGFSRVGSNSPNSTALDFTAPMTPRGPDGGALKTSGSSDMDFYSGSLVVARRFGANGLGIELASLRGTGSNSGTTGALGPDGRSESDVLRASTDVTQTRLTLGYSHDFAHGPRLGVYYRYAFIDSKDRDSLHLFNNFSMGLESTATAGHTSEFGARLRGMITPRLYYGFAGSWLGISLLDGLVRQNTGNSHERDRAYRGSVGAGLGYSLSRRTILTFDLAGGASHNSALRTEDSTLRLLQNSGSTSRFISLHGAVQHDLTRRLFVSASYLNVWQSDGLNLSLFPDRYGNIVQVSDTFSSLTSATSAASHFSDYGVGWRFTPNLWVQYVYSTDYGFSSATHSLLLRYTLRRNR
jgi:hypothetical protein